MSGFDLSRLGAWRDLPFFTEDWPAIEAQLAGTDFLPPAPLVFAALERAHPDTTRVLIVGQDPYPTPGHANGLAFSTAPDITPLPASLRNIYKELQADLHVTRHNGDLSDWADQGVLMLNAALSVPPHGADGHKRLGWSRLIAQVLDRLDPTPRALLLWGKSAQTLARRMTNPDHLRIETAHPSPLSAHRGFLGSCPFSRVNAWLEARNTPPIRWSPA